ncbi:MAG: Do family serine endopeptidase [Gammaproteobacteria bacterium]|nr:Do family serine endopeptidase [Gammaproteobacteria bacterium]
MSHRFAQFRILAVLASAGLLAACSPQSSTAANAAPPTAAAAASAAPAAPLVRGMPDFAALVEKVGPTVVNVAVVARARAQRGAEDSPFGADDPFGDFFRRFGIPNPRRDDTPARGEGSGFIVSPDGYILTNAHVVANASKVTVKLTDRREFEAKVIGSDERTDVAVIKIAANNLPTVRIGDPSRLRAGEWVAAIGSPFGFENSVTVGVVSGIARNLPGESGNYVPFIQTDVAVNPGNSGGPLFNLNGEVVGINSQIYSNTGAYQGLSFAIPIDVANGVREQLVKGGRVSRGRIGVTIQEVSALLAENFGLDRPRGAAVSSVEAGGPADKAGVKPQDVILSVNGRAIEHSNEVPAIIAAIRPGGKAELELWRDRAVKRITVTVDELKESSTVARSGGGAQGGDAIDRLGLSVRVLSGEEKQQLRTQGSLIVVDSDGAAAEAGIRSGDVILAANRVRVGSIEELRSAVKGSGRTASLLVQRGEQQQIVAIRIE